MHVCVVLCLIEQKIDEQNSMDTSQNDTADEHSLPNSSEVAEVCALDSYCLPECSSINFQPDYFYTAYLLQSWSSCLDDNRFRSTYSHINSLVGFFLS